MSALEILASTVILIYALANLHIPQGRPTFYHKTQVTIVLVQYAEDLKLMVRILCACVYTLTPPPHSCVCLILRTLTLTFSVNGATDVRAHIEIGLFY